MDVRESSVEKTPPDDDGEVQPKSQSSLTDDRNSRNKPDDSTVDQTDTNVRVASECHGNNTLNKPVEEMIYSPWCVEKEQPQPLSTLLPPSTGQHSVYEMTRSHTSTSRRRTSLPTNTGQTHLADGDDLCASVLWACLFCEPLDCLLVTGRCCCECGLYTCSWLCGCEPAALGSTLSYCDCCGCLGARCCLCDCTICEICLPVAECLDLAMEISQMCYH